MPSAKLPNGSRLTLGGRDPVSADVRSDLAKAAAVAAEFNVVFDCALDDAVAVYEQLLNSIEKETAHRLVERSRQMYRSLKVGAKTADKPVPEGKSRGTLH